MHPAACLLSLPLSLSLSLAAAAHAAPPRLEPAWRTEGLANPESIAADPSGGFFVSNVAGEADARDGIGFVSRLAADGALLQREWVAGLDAPKGLLLRDGKLFVSDIDRLVVIDVATGEVEARHAVPGARFLNDVAAGRDGAVLVSDSGGARIHALVGGAVVEWLAHDALRSVNGLLPEPDRLVVSTMQGRLLAVDWDSKAVTVLAEGLGNADGVVRLDDGSYLVGEWPGRLFHVVPAAGAAASVATLLDSREQKHYLNDFLRQGELLLVPNWEPSTVTAYRLR
jgi:hypothetical protein